MVQSNRERGILAASASLGVLALVAGVAAAQPARSAILTRPDPPPRELLDRLNLRMAWRAHVPIDGERDGLAHVQVLGRDLLVQTRGGLIILIDAETGETRWRNRAGVPYRILGGPTANSHSVVFANNAFLYGLDRANGALVWQFHLPGGLSGSPIVDEESVYFATVAGRFYNYFLPRPELVALGSPEERERAEINEILRKERRGTATVTRFTTVGAAGEAMPTGAQPSLVWDDVIEPRIGLTPLLTRDSVVIPGKEGLVVGLGKVVRASGEVAETFRFQADGPIIVQPGQFQETLYLASQDGNLHAINLRNGRVIWRFTTGQPFVRQPAVLEKDVFIVTGGQGMTRIDRSGGVAPWRVPRGREVLDSNFDVDRFLAANPKFVYTADRIGRLQVLDRRLGHTLSTIDTRDFVFPVQNEQTDRVYLAANNGLIVCLHDKEYTKPFRHRKLEEDLTSEVRKKLAQPVNDPGGRPTPLATVLETFQAKYAVRIQIADRAFTEVGMEPPGPRLVAIPKVDNLPLGEVLARILGQVSAKFDVVEDTVVVLPAPRKK
jgi:outer membrane protein assembly factor BamB